MHTKKISKHESYTNLSLAFMRVTRVQRRERETAGGGRGMLT